MAKVNFAKDNLFLKQSEAILILFTAQLNQTTHSTTTELARLGYCLGDPHNITKQINFLTAPHSTANSGTTSSHQVHHIAPIAP